MLTRSQIVESPLKSNRSEQDKEDQSDKEVEVLEEEASDKAQTEKSQADSVREIQPIAESSQTQVVLPPIEQHHTEASVVSANSIKHDMSLVKKCIVHIKKIHEV